MSMALDDKQQGHDDHQLPELAEPRSTAEVAEALAASGMVDELLAQIDTGQVQITGDGGLIPGLIKLALERGLKAELTDHLGYDKGDPAGRELPNARNGSTPKTVASEAGPVELNVPRDRDGTFTPRLVPKGSRRLGGLDDIIISLYAGGMTLRDIQHHLASTIGTDLSHETISKICDEVLDAVDEWQNRPLEALYPVIYLDALVVKVKDGAHVRNKHAHIAIGVDMAGIKHVLGIWIQAEEGARFWAGVCANLANRGVKDVLVVCCDGLTGFPEAIEATWPLATVQTCVVHLIRNSMRFVNYKDRKAVAAALKPIYQAVNEDAALEALTEPCQVALHTDSRYVQQGISEWLPNWIRRGWKTAGGDPVKNRDLWERLHLASQRHSIDWKWVKGHSGHPENERVDTLARLQAESRRPYRP